MEVRIAGDRPDNQWLQYNSNKLPRTQGDWDKCMFVEKTHWGYYCWPRYSFYESLGSYFCLILFPFHLFVLIDVKHLSFYNCSIEIWWCTHHRRSSPNRTWEGRKWQRFVTTSSLMQEFHPMHPMKVIVIFPPARADHLWSLLRSCLYQPACWVSLSWGS